MAIGYRLPISDYGRIPNLSVSYPTDLTIPLGPWNGIDAIPSSSGSRTQVLAEALPKRQVGYQLHSFFDDFYNNIYLIPESLNFGAVTSTMEMDVYVWNAYLRENMLSSIVETNGSGVAISGPSLPAHFNRLQGRIYTVTASTEGPAYIDARYTFQFEGVAPHSVLPVFGSRAELWKLPPNWNNRYQLTYQYSTDIFTSRSGKEQRRALRNTPRLQVEFSATGHGDDLRWFNNIMAGWHRNAFLMPEYTRNVLTTSHMPAGGAVVNVASVPAWLVPGASVILAQGRQFAARLVESVNGNTVKFTSIGNDDWPAGAKLHPGLGGRLSPDLTTSRLTSEAGTIAVIFDETPGDGIPSPLPAAPLTHNGLELVLHKPNYAVPIRLTHSWPVEQVDFNRGRTKTFVPVNFATRTFQAEYLRIGRKQAQDFLDIFRRMKGRRGSFYMPTWENDLPPMDGLPAGGFRIRVAGIDVDRLMDNRTTHRYLIAFTVGGDYYINKVEQISTVSDDRGNDTIIAVSTPWPVAVTKEQILRICWLPQWRFASDGLTVSWVTDEVATITTTLQMLEDLS